MKSTRIEYIDYLKGLSIIWVVWFHTIHPEFVEYPIRIPLFFFISGIFFRPYPFTKFISKKINSLIIPFFFFYLLYYLFYIVLWLTKYKGLSNFDFSTIFQLFYLYQGNETFIINPPLWFICALLNLQILQYIIVKLIKRKVWILIISIFLTLLGVFFSFEIPTPFMIGRSLNYFIYYTLGFLFGAKISNLFKSPNNTKQLKFILGLTLVTIVISLFFKRYILFHNLYAIKIIDYFEVLAIIIVMMYVFNIIYKYSILTPLKFFGMNSYVVLGMHEIYLTGSTIILHNTIGEISIELGFLQTIITLIILWPTIIVLNKYMPRFVGKGNII